MSVWFIRVWESEEGNQKKEKENRKTIFSATFYFHRYKMQNDVRFKNLWKMNKDCKCARTRKRKSQRTRERKITDRERENYRECDEYLYFSWMLRSLSLLNICSDCWMRSFWGLEFCDKNHSNNSNILVSSDRFPLLSNLLESIQIRHSGGKREAARDCLSTLTLLTNFFHGRVKLSFSFFLLPYYFFSVIGWSDFTRRRGCPVSSKKRPEPKEAWD